MTNTAADKRKNEAAQALKVNEDKWGKTAMAAGWTAFPSIILEKQHALGLDALEINIILYLCTYWWKKDNKPHPSKKAIAEALGVAPRTIQRRIANLERDGFIKREFRPDKEKGNKTNCYSFDGLIKAIEGFAQEKVNSIKERKKEEESRRSRKKPRLQTIEGGRK